MDIRRTLCLEMSSEDDPRILRLRREMLGIKENLRKKSQALDQCQKELDLLEGWAALLERGDTLPKEALDSLEIITSTGWTKLTLRLRLRGQAENVEERRESVRREVTRLNDALKSMETCPQCSGAGKVFTLVSYERMDEGAIIPRPQSKICNLCAGNGKIILA
jgi:hypothetical protein